MERMKAYVCNTIWIFQILSSVELRNKWDFMYFIHNITIKYLLVEYYWVILKSLEITRKNGEKYWFHIMWIVNYELH